MNTVYNPLTGQWERVDDLVRPYPVIARDTWLVGVNDTTSFVPSLGTGNLTMHTDLFGNTDSWRANIGIESSQAQPDIVVPDAWRIRRFIVLAKRTATGSTNVGITCTVYGRLVAPDDTTTSWRIITNVTDTGNGTYAIRFGLPTSLSGVFGYDQYRIVFRRDPDSTPAPELSLIRVYAEF